jgi:hypothetical protein
VVGKGLNPERSSTQKLDKYASRHEEARKTLKRERISAAYGTHSNLAYFGRTADAESPADSEDQENSTRDSGSDNDSVVNNSELNADPQENETFNGRNTRVLLPQAEFE